MTTKVTQEQKIQQRLAEIGKRGLMHRTATVGNIDIEARTVELSFSSETEKVERWFGIEILGHDPGECDLSRLNNGAPVCWMHDLRDQRGVVVAGSGRIDADKVGRCIAKYSRKEEGEDLFQDIADGIVTKVSVGYSVRGMKFIEERDGVDVFRITSWQPYEISNVSVAADDDVGIGRAAEIPQEESTSPPSDTGIELTRTLTDNRTQKTMIIKNIRNAAGHLVRVEVDEDGKIVKELEVLEHASVSATQASQRGTEDERARVRSINELSAKFGKAIENIDELSRAALNDGVSSNEFQRTILEAMDKRMAKPLSDQAAGADIGLTEREVRQFSLLRVVRALSDPSDKRAQKEAEFEFSASHAAAEKAGKNGERFMVPTDVLRRSVYDLGDKNRAMNTGTGGAAAGDTGGYGIQTNLLTSSFIDILRNRATIMKFGRVLGGLQGNIDIPKQASGATGYWLGEDDDATETGMELGQMSLTPKTVAAFSEITRKLMMQSSLDVEAMLRADLAIALALTIDTAGYYGTGTQHQPLGIANTTGINAQVIASSGAPTFAELVAMETKIAQDNADVNGMKYVANSGFRGHAKTTLKFAGVAGTIWEPGNGVNGYGAEITNQVAAADVFFGNFQDLIIGMWGGMELHVDPFSNSKKGRIRLIAFQDVDFGLRRVESFCLGRPA